MSPLEKGKTTPQFSPGDRVVITMGLAVGKRGVVVSRWPRAFSGIPMWVIRSLDIVGTRVMRADHLRLEVPS